MISVAIISNYIIMPVILSWSPAHTVPPLVLPGPAPLMMNHSQYCTARPIELKVDR